MDWAFFIKQTARRRAAIISNSRNYSIDVYVERRDLFREHEADWPELLDETRSYFERG